MWMWITCALLAAAYLLGSISGSLLLGRLRGVDIRTQGSGNAGGTNALRTQGWRFALGVVLIDVGKGALAAAMAALMLPGASHAIVLATVFATMAGHIWPVFHGFRGGKGAATLVGGLAVAWPLALLPVLATWIVSLVLTGYVGLSTVLAALALAAFAAFAAIPPQDPTRFAFALAVAALIVYTHRDNLRRVRAGTESRFERARLFHRARRTP
ncbi:MAG: glycerol-3-phosphate 1-O-acyltransferase PlsY [Arenimonas sp.]